MDYKLQKVGIQLLSGEKLTNIFPNYNELFENIEMCRERIEYVDKKRHYQYNLMYDNVFSIIGKRGTGKTSAIFSLKKIIDDKEQHPYDLTLPIIMPDVITGTEGMLDWILAGLEDVVEKIENRLKEKEEKPQFDQACRYMNGDNTRYLREKYEKLLEWNFSNQYTVGNGESFYEAVGNSTKKARNSYRLMKEMSQFWDDLVNGIRKVNGNDEINPLIFFFFDDVDLSPEKVEELLASVRAYLAHPNVVVIMTADEDVFLEVIENNLDEKMKRPQKDVRRFLKSYNPFYYAYNFDSDEVSMEREEDDRDKKALDDMGRMYLGKVMPPSTRYYLKLFSYPEDKRNFECDFDGKRVTLMDFINNRINKLIGNDLDSNDNFLYHNGRENTFYLEFIGDTARQIGNEIWIINNLIENLTRVTESKKKQNINQIYNYLYHFLHTSIVANHKMTGVIGDVEDFLNEFIKRDYNGWKLYIDYNYINQYIESCIEQGKEEALVWHTGIQIYALGYFTENIIFILEKKEKYFGQCRKKIHGMNAFLIFLYQSGFEKNLFRSSMTVNEFLNHYGKLLSKFSELQNKNDADHRYTKKYLYFFSEFEENTVMDIHTLFTWYTNDEAWLMKICGMLFMFYEGIYELGIKEITNSLLLWKEPFKFVYEKRIIEEELANLGVYISRLNVKEQALEEMHELKEALDKKSILGINHEVLSEIDFTELFEYQMIVSMEDVIEELCMVPDMQIGSIDEWIDIQIFLGIVDTGKELEEKMRTKKGWLEILSETRFVMEEYKRNIRYYYIIDKEEVINALEELKEYRNGSYLEQLENAKTLMNAEWNQFEKEKSVALPNGSSAKTFLNVIKDIYSDARSGMKFGSKSFNDSYKTYVKDCEKIFKNIDTGIDIDSKEQSRSAVFLYTAMQSYQWTQRFYYDFLFSSGDMHEIRTEDMKKNYYYQLYKFVKDEVLSSEEEENEYVVLRPKLEECIVNARREYINKMIYAED